MFSRLKRIRKTGCSEALRRFAFKPTKPNEFSKPHDDGRFRKNVKSEHVPGNSLKRLFLVQGFARFVRILISFNSAELKLLMVLKGYRCLQREICRYGAIGTPVRQKAIGMWTFSAPLPATASLSAWISSHPWPSMWHFIDSLWTSFGRVTRRRRLRVTVSSSELSECSAVTRSCSPSSSILSSLGLQSRKRMRQVLENPGRGSDTFNPVLQNRIKPEAVKKSFLIHLNDWCMRFVKIVSRMDPCLASSNSLRKVM